MKIQLLKVLVLCCTFLSFGTTAQHSFIPETPPPFTFPKPAVVPCGLHDDVLPDRTGKQRSADETRELYFLTLPL